MPQPRDLVRVRKDGFEFNVGAAYAAAHKLDVLDASAYDTSGRPRDITRTGGRKVKPRVSITAKVSEKKAAESADQPDTAPSSEEN